MVCMSLTTGVLGASGVSNHRKMFIRIFPFSWRKCTKYSLKVSGIFLKIFITKFGDIATCKREKTPDFKSDALTNRPRCLPLPTD